MPKWLWTVIGVLAAIVLVLLIVFFADIDVKGG